MFDNPFSEHSKKTDLVQTLKLYLDNEQVAKSDVLYDLYHRLKDLLGHYTRDIIIKENDNRNEIFDVPFYIENPNGQDVVSFAINITKVLTQLISAENIQPTGLAKKNFYPTFFRRPEFIIQKGNVLPKPLKFYDENEEVPPVTIFAIQDQPKRYFLIDGNHRIDTKAYKHSKTIPTYILDTDLIEQHAAEIFLSKFDETAYELMRQLSNKNRNQSV